MCDCHIFNCKLAKKCDILDIEDAYEKYSCENSLCNNEICDNCFIICKCGCNNKICQLCANICEIGACQNYVCIQNAKEVKNTKELQKTKEVKKTEEIQKKMIEEKKCQTGCGRTYICIDHRYINEDIIICYECAEDSEYDCKCGINCNNDIIYKNCEIKCMVRKECTNYINLIHMKKNNLNHSCKNCGEFKYACIDCFIIINDEKYCKPCFLGNN